MNTFESSVGKVQPRLISVEEAGAIIGVKKTMAYKKSIGVKLGRPSALTQDKMEQLEFLSSKGKSVKEMCEKLSISKPTYYKWIKSRESESVPG